MSALENIKQKPKLEKTQLEWAILVCLEQGGEATAASAAAELAAKDAEIARLREQVVDVNELLWEFAENPNIELGEKGHNKIEDYFKKYASQEAK